MENEMTPEQAEAAEILKRRHMRGQAARRRWIVNFERTMQDWHKQQSVDPVFASKAMIRAVEGR